MLKKAIGLLKKSDLKSERSELYTIRLSSGILTSDIFPNSYEGQMFAVNRTVANVATDPHEPPPNFAFLEILAEFSAKLMKQDKKTVRMIQLWREKNVACILLFDHVRRMFESYRRNVLFAPGGFSFGQVDRRKRDDATSYRRMARSRRLPTVPAAWRR